MLKPFTSRLDTVGDLESIVCNLNRLLHGVNYAYLNNCKIVDVISLFEGLVDLYECLYVDHSRVEWLLQQYNVKGYPMIYLYSDNTRTDLLTWYKFNITQNLDLLYAARDGGLVYVYEMNDYQVEGGL